MAQYISSGLWCKCAAKRAHMHSPHLAHIDKRMHAIFFSYRDVWGLRRLIGSGIQKSFVFHSVLCVDQSLAPVQLYSCTLHTQCIWRCNACAVQDERSAMCAFRWMCKFILLEIFIVIHLFSCNLYQTRLFSCLFFFCRVLAEVLCDVRAHSWETSSSLWSTRLTELSCCGAFFFIHSCVFRCRAQWWRNMPNIHKYIWVL